MQNDIYKEELMDIYKNPVNKGKIKDPSVDVHRDNPLCGDEVNLQLKIEDGAIKDAKFYGSACAVSIISSEILTDALVGMKVVKAKKLEKDDLLKMIGLNLSTSRVKCATLILDALKGALEVYD